jgi:hypothetical protein
MTRGGVNVVVIHLESKCPGQWSKTQLLFPFPTSLAASVFGDSNHSAATWENAFDTCSIDMSQRLILCGLWRTGDAGRSDADDGIISDSREWNRDSHQQAPALLAGESRKMQN